MSTILADGVAGHEFIESRARLFDRVDFECDLDSIPDFESEEHDRVRLGSTKATEFQADQARTGLRHAKDMFQFEEMSQFGALFRRKLRRPRVDPDATKSTSSG